MGKEFNALHRQELKSNEGEFLYELQYSYELSPRLSEQILQTAKQSLIRGFKNHQDKSRWLLRDWKKKAENLYCE